MPGSQKMTPEKPKLGWTMALNRGDNSTTRPPERENEICDGREGKKKSEILGGSADGAIQRSSVRQRSGPGEGQSCRGHKMKNIPLPPKNENEEKTKMMKKKKNWRERGLGRYHGAEKMITKIIRK